LTLTIIGQRVLPQRFLEPLHKTHKLFCLVRVVIWFSSMAALLTCFMTPISQLSVDAVLLGFCVRVMTILE
jgi:hypothetical protein